MLAASYNPRRRDVLRLLAALGFCAACDLDPGPPAEDDTSLPDRPNVPWPSGPQEPDPDPDAAARDNILALIDVLIPAEFDPAGNLLSPGAVEAGAYETLSLSTFVPAARSLALLPRTATPGFEDLDRFDAAVRLLVSSDLDVLASTLHPLTPFRGLTRAEQERAVADGFADPLTRPLLLFVRTACFVAYLGALHNDAGLVAIGFPPFVDFERRIANFGYPRRRDGQTLALDATNLAALAAEGELDDYTFNRIPPPTADDDLSAVIDDNGDMI